MTAPRPKSHALLPALAAAALCACSGPAEPPPDTSRVPFAVLGDSDSHAYQDRVSFPPYAKSRGGAHRDSSRQWTEVLAALRVDEVDPGGWGVWGVQGHWARLAEAFGGSRRSPRKQDFAFNFAWSGARCADLMEGPGRQASRLVALMGRHRDAWSRGVVVVRIGVNDLGTRDALDAFAREGDGEAHRRLVDACLGFVEQSVRAIAEAQPEVHVLLVGVLDNVDWPRNAARFTDAGERARIAAVLDRFDAGLRRIAAASPNHAFFDDRALFRRLVGQRLVDGAPGYRDVPVRDASGDVVFEATFREGDALDALYLADGHMGTVLNAHWAQALIEALRREFGLPITPVSDIERDAVLIDLHASHGKLAASQAE